VLLTIFGVFAALFGWWIKFLMPLFVFGPFLFGGLVVAVVGLGVALTTPVVTIDSRSGATR
jgi:hypothetical protein